MEPDLVREREAHPVQVEAEAHVAVGNAVVATS